MLKKSLAIGIILLFISSGIIPVVISDNPISTKTIYVDDDNTEGPWDGTQEHPYQFIQDGIDTASDGDTVFVYSGIYKEIISFEKSLSLIGEDKDTTIIHGYLPDDEEFPAVVLFPVDGAAISGFTIENATGGIMVYSMYQNSANNCSISDIIFKTKEGIGLDIFLEGSTNMKIHDNIMNHGMLIYETFGNIIEENVIHGKPLVYLENKSDQTITNAGQVILNRCENITVMNLEISDTYSGIQLYKSNHSYVYNNVLSDNYYGIYIQSEYNIIEQNTIESNEYGILFQSHKWNKIFHNNFITNFDHVSGFSSSYNIWYDSVTKGGNYWDDYNGTDGDGDGIGDTPYVIYLDEQDLYPFMNPDGWLNNPPNKPSQPQGETNGKAGKQYAYSTSTVDVDGDLLYYKWDWGDNKTSDWIGAFISGDTDTEYHIWDEKGSYEIKVKARDINGVESPWSDPLAITMPINKAINPFILFLERLMERFPILEQILQPLYDRLAGL